MSASPPLLAVAEIPPTVAAVTIVAPQILVDVISVVIMPIVNSVIETIVNGLVIPAVIVITVAACQIRVAREVVRRAVKPTAVIIRRPTPHIARTIAIVTA